MTRRRSTRRSSANKESDDYRAAHPDRIVVKFSLDANVIDQRKIADSGEDQRALTLGDTVQPASLATVFDNDRFADRRTDELDPFVIYFAVNTQKVPNLEHRKAIAVALDRAQLRTIEGGEFAGELADGVIKPNMPKDYEPSGMWSGLLGVDVPDNGDPEAAKSIIEASGEPMPTLTPEKEGHLVWAGWGPDWSNASTVIPELSRPPAVSTCRTATTRTSTRGSPRPGR